MRSAIIFLLFLLVSCRSETASRSLQISTEVEIKLPAAAIYGNLSSFSGFHATAPDLFIDEKIEDKAGQLTRTLILTDQTTLVDVLIEVNDHDRSIRYRTIQSTLPLDNMTHDIHVVELSSGHSRVEWMTHLNVQNQYREAIEGRIRGIQETYLFSLELLGEELDVLLNDPGF